MTALVLSSSGEWIQPQSAVFLPFKLGPAFFLASYDNVYTDGCSGLYCASDKAFAVMHLPDMGHQVRDFKVFTWGLTDWGNLPHKHSSPSFKCGGHEWNISLFPLGNIPKSQQVVSLYLQRVSGKDSAADNDACAQFALVVTSVKDRSNFIVLRSNHRFNGVDSDWGFTKFCQQDDLLKPRQGHSGPIVEEEVEVIAYVRVMEDPTGFLWFHDFQNYDSKKATGCVGLKNQGATSYLNSVLQVLFSLRDFRKAVFQIPTQSPVESRRVSLGLQRVFYMMQVSNEVVSTKELTSAFGWTALDSMIANDATEFQRVLMDKLEGEMKGTKLENTIVRLFVGEMRNFIHSGEVGFESSRIEEYSSIDLKVNGLGSLQESLEDYIKAQPLAGELASRAGARKGLVFNSFPPVLDLRLKRFRYDIEKDSMVKIFDRHEFPFQIDLSEFLDKKADQSQSWVYILHGVIMHSGDINQGYNYAYVKPEESASWLKFDDDRVIPITDSEVQRDGFGTGNFDAGTHTAYILTYVRQCTLGQVLAPLTEEDVPHHLKIWYEQERTQAEAKKRALEEAKNSLIVATSDSFKTHVGFDVASFDDKEGQPSQSLPTFKISIEETFTAFRSRVATHLDLQQDRMRLWVMVNRQNKTTRPDAIIQDNEPTLTMGSIRANFCRSSDVLRLYLAVVPAGSKPTQTPGFIFIYLKHFDPLTQTLHGVGTLNVARNSKVLEVKSWITRRMSWDPVRPISIYEVKQSHFICCSLTQPVLQEVKPGLIEEISQQLSFAQCELQDGDILCFQAVPSGAQIRALETIGLLSNAKQFYEFMHSSPVAFQEFLQARVKITFRQKSALASLEFTLLFDKKQSYDMMREKVGEILNHDPARLRFTGTDPISYKSKDVIAASSHPSIANMIWPHWSDTSPTIILFEKM
ncbi:hypothetical protein HYDPIDRAFT_32705 [Hydnomerulius pinastri MD-312]|uniref:Ubiquitinyl hydrolase 1 n=1 Tax=Hydnomerulius pinastri MD-312 TaxID=994086 RepID=A0A0C9W9J5_9AGAM|nr:hypothetical protein HYDPIDRAFT_32705 [Hydnomerulius pinastri MD-312]